MAERVFSRVHSFRECLDSTLTTQRSEILRVLLSHGKGILKPHRLMAKYDAISKEDTKLHDGAFHEVLKSTQEAIVLPPWVALSICLRPEELVDGSSNDNFLLELDFKPFTSSFPRPTLTKSIGNGVEFLNRHLSAKMFHDKDSMHPLLDFLRTHTCNGKIAKDRSWRFGEE
ncbi:hypothetical protein L2E82_44518 [Cichorium intybus]|uniref:Uncharacterized protein n=1 Tax=Cichorium intybus TaxID=13427 RepID=A0ACB8ZRG7_CICIN|nr:hypothetical protein L2E82_44518 [Cichorium intybus]